ncbi:MaoC family dehydratase N-terminal domain-containing protein [Aurantimonas sp. VKM B-3413]|uniref:MaoC family dehydratase n=1 Tax=Aurantimonas sp. VKM B-3413 TaxID=2779401 RepID=UPI001E5C42D2|nr:MaoC family dehydratase N-terminal domain-containing protein [Aurantimonas sp. VKM B-3413]MCB8838058.1 MaoC family dehydratase N-terminal domain-containing protein [Aurantimonas sp. VKM B-3413]
MTTDTRNETPWRDLTDPRRAGDFDDLEAGLKDPVFENLDIPESFGPITITVDDHKIKRFAFTQDDYNPWSLEGSPFGGKRIGQACLLGNDLVQLFTLKYAGSKTVGFHTEEQMWFENPVFLGEKVTLSGEYVEAFERRGQGYVVMEARAVGEDGRTIIRHRGVEILRTVPGAIAGRGSGTPERRVSGDLVEGARQVESIGPDTAIGDELVPLSKVITAEQTAVFSRIGEYVRNTHSDFLVARAGQLRMPIVQGQQQVGVLGEFLTRAFGAAWFTSGWLQVKFINTLEVFEPIRVYGKVVGIETDKNGRPQAELEVWIRRASDQKPTTVGWARGPIPA